jgi:hypothetical protein
MNHEFKNKIKARLYEQLLNERQVTNQPIVISPQPGDPNFVGPVQPKPPQPGDPDFVGPVDPMQKAPWGYDGYGPRVPPFQRRPWDIAPIGRKPRPFRTI